jgi:hypothetical protein
MIRCSLNLACTVLAVVAIPTPLWSQEVELQGIQSWSAYDVLSSPTGIGLGYTSDQLGPIAFRIGYLFRSDGETRLGPTCTGLVDPSADCPVDVLEENFDLHTGELGLILALPLHPRAEMHLGASAVKHWVDGGARGRETGREVTPVMAKESDLEWAFTGRLAWSFAQWDRLGLFAGGRLESLGLESCGEDAWFPFCGTGRLASFTAGILYRLPSGS